MMIQQLTMGWLVYDLTGSAVLLGALSALRMLPFLIFGPVCGVIVDRVDRRKLMTSLYCLFSIISFAMGGVVALGIVQVWHLFAFVLITGIMASFLITVEQSLIPNTVPREELMNAVALDFGAFNTTRVIAPVLGGFLIPLFGAAGNLFVESVVTSSAAFMTYSLRLAPVKASSHKSSVLAHFQGRGWLSVVQSHGGDPHGRSPGPSGLCHAAPGFDADLSERCVGGRSRGARPIDGCPWFGGCGGHAFISLHC